MGLSAVSELPEVSTISDQDLLMVSHTDDGVNYTSNKLTYKDLQSSITDKIVDLANNAMCKYSFFQLGKPAKVTVKPSASIQMNSMCIMTVSNDNLLINGTQCSAYNAFQINHTKYYNGSGTSSSGIYRFVVYPGDVISNPTDTSGTARLAPILNMDGQDVLNDPELAYSGTFNLLEFYNRFTAKALSEYSQWFDMLNINYSNTRGITNYEHDEKLYFKKIQLECDVPEGYVVNIEVNPKSVTVYDLRTFKKQSFKKRVNSFVSDSYLRFLSLGSYCSPIDDIGITISIVKVYSDLTEA